MQQELARARQTVTTFTVEQQQAAPAAMKLAALAKDRPRQG